MESSLPLPTENRLAGDVPKSIIEERARGNGICSRPKKLDNSRTIGSALGIRMTWTPSCLTMRPASRCRLPFAASLLKEPSGSPVGKEGLRNYFVRGLEAYPNLNFVLHDVLFGLNTVVLYYANHKGAKTAEFMEVDAARKVIRVVANYSE